MLYLTEGFYDYAKDRRTRGAFKYVPLLFRNPVIEENSLRHESLNVCHVKSDLLDRFAKMSRHNVLKHAVLSWRYLFAMLGISRNVNVAKTADES